MRNASDQTVQFLYSELSVVNEQGQEVSATTDGLPSDLPAASDTFSGTITIPAKALSGTSKLALSLPNYPDRSFQLELSDIPVPR